MIYTRRQTAARSVVPRRKLKMTHEERQAIDLGPAKQKARWKRRAAAGPPSNSGRAQRDESRDDALRVRDLLQRLIDGQNPRDG
jgi:hypothetical protein